MLTSTSSDSQSMSTCPSQPPGPQTLSSLTTIPFQETRYGSFSPSYRKEEYRLALVLTKQHRRTTLSVPSSKGFSSSYYVTSQMSVTPCTGCKKRRNSSFYKDQIRLPPNTLTAGVMPPSYTFPSRKVPPWASPMTTRSLEGYSHLLHKSSNSLSFVHR